MLPSSTVRRILSLFAMLILLGLAMTLLWLVYRHHERVDPYEREEPVSVEFEAPLDGPRLSFVKIATHLS